MFSKDLENVLLNHSKMYPYIDIEDLIKLIYQFTLGPAHIFSASLDKVKEQIFLEGRNNKKTTKEFVYIGNDLYRVSLINDEEYLNKVFDCFVKTSEECLKNNKNADLKSNILESVNYLSFFKNINKEAYVNNINNYLNGELKPISHSKKYKDLYNPSYRLIHRKFLKKLSC